MLRIQFLLPLVCGLSMVAACSSKQAPVATQAIGSVDTTFESRGVAVPATIVMPAISDGKPLPLVVMAHGHGGSRQEGGGYQLVAEAMAKQGIASIRMDFPGCGDSSESFTENNLSNMLLDLQAARVFAEHQAGINIDGDRIGLLGYSMGGRLVALLSEIDPSYKAMVMWSPAVADGAMREFDSLGGIDAYQAYKEKARTTGMAEFTTQWGSTLQLGYRWFTDMEETKPLESLASFEGPLLVVYGDQDSVVVPATSEAAIAAAKNSKEVKRHVVAGAEHALGFYTDKPDFAAEVVNATAEFLGERL
jgi:dienelactone hydrolase